MDKVNKVEVDNEAEMVEEKTNVNGDGPTNMETDEPTSNAVNGASASSKKGPQVYIPGISRELKSSEKMVCDKRYYKLYKQFQCENPCLSFDTVADNIGGGRSAVGDGFPVTSTIVGGTQAAKIRDNGIVMMHLRNLHKRREKSDEEEEDEESSSSESEDESDQTGPLMLSAKIPHHGGVNRIRVTRISTATVCAVWNDQKKVQLWNLESCLKAIAEMADGKKNQSIVLKSEKPIFSFAGHQSEGFAVDWSSISPGKLATGDNKARIHVWNMGEGGEWSVDQRPYSDHTDSVEDIQWSPTEDNVFASCSVDSTIRLWDARVSPAQACVCSVEKAHDSDVNVISWNKKEPFLLSGGDDGAIKVWDLKTIQYKHPVAVFKHHTKPITSVHWYPHDSTVFGVSGEDDQVTIWDLSVEADRVAQSSNDENEEKVPPQLLFVHCGQKAIKEIRWHPQIVGVLATTAEDGFNIFRPTNM